MKFDMEEEVEMMPLSKKKGIEDQPEEAMDLGKAIQVLKDASKKEGKSIEDLIRTHEQGQDESESDEEEKEEMHSGEEEMQPSDGGDKEKKRALYIAQLKAKRG